MTKRCVTRSRSAFLPFGLSRGSAGEARGRQLLRAALEADAEGLGCLLRLGLEGDGCDDAVDADPQLGRVDPDLEADAGIRLRQRLDLLAVELEDDAGDVLTGDAG